MLVKYWKNFKWFLFIPLIVFIFIFKISNVSAYVYKGTGRMDVNDYTFTNSVASGNERSTTFTFNTPILKNGYDVIQFRFNKFLFYSDELIDIDNPYLEGATLPTYLECVQWENNTTCKKFKYYTSNTSFPQSLYGSIGNGDYFVRAVVVDKNNVYTPCYLTSEIEDSLICPMLDDLVNLQITVSQRNFDTFNFYMNFSSVIGYWNYDQTEMTVQQNQTNTNLQYIYQYQQNDSVSGSTTQVQGDFSDLATSFNSELQGVNDLSQLVLMPISLFMDLSTDNCQPLHLQIPYVNMSVDLPCMKAIFNQYFNGLYSIFTTIMSAVICYWVAIKTGALVKEIVDCDNDRIEVVDL